MEVKNIAIKKIRVSRGQVRKDFDENKIKSLAESMQEVGQLQPVIVKKEGLYYLLIAGERRLRAVKANRETEIAAIVLEADLDNSSLKQIQLVENIQRQDLNPLERAQAIKGLIDENKYTKKEASKKLGVARTTLTEWLNILDVKKKYQNEVIDEDSPLSLSHISLAKALASRTGDPTRLNQLLDGILQYNFSREETKEIVDIIYRYLHISTDEAIDAVLLKRRHKKIIYEQENEKTKNNSQNPARDLLNSFANLSNRLNTLIDKVEFLDDKEKKNLLDEFLYIYQMMGIMIPELKEKQLNQIFIEFKEGY